MNILLDTHIALWAVIDSPKLSTYARNLILDPRNSIWVSAVSVWEIAIKHSLQRGDMPISGEMAVRYFRAAGYLLLPIEVEHAAAVETLPLYHNDPFDRLLIAQARVASIYLLTNDTQIVRYKDLVNLL